MKEKTKNRRPGLTLIELLVAIAIIVVLIGLLVPAVMKVREAAVRMQSTNNMRQIVLATQNFANAHGERLPNIEGDDSGPNRGQSLFVAILPFIEQENVQAVILADQTQLPLQVKTYVSPADPTVTGKLAGAVSYAANAQVFNGRCSLNWTFRDGTSNTIAFAEHYAEGCGGVYFVYYGTDSGVHRATFADGGPDVDRYANCGDYYPITNGSPPTSTISPASFGLATFQVRPWPAYDKCDPHLANTPHRSGMVTALGDGSVRTLAPTMATTTYWGAVTPSRGELPGIDW